jgi:hypothetical protein
VSLLDDMKRNGIEADNAVYYAVLKSLARIGTTDAAETATDILQRITKDHFTLACVGCYVSTMFAWCNSAAGCSQCEEILQQLENRVRQGDRRLAPLDSSPYRALIEAWIKQDPSSAAHEADKILKRVEDAALEGIAAAPDNKLYASVMMAHWKSGAQTSMTTLDRLEELVQEMKRAYANGNLAAKPDAQAMTILLHAYAKSTVEDKVTIALKLLNQMIEAYLQQGDLDSKPTTYSFAAVLNACAYTNGSPEQAVQVALQAMTALTGGHFDPPNSFIYTNFFQVLGRQLEDQHERSRIAAVIFQRCSAEGHVNERVLAALRECVPELYKKLPMDSKTRKLSLPAEWTRHASRRQ